MGLLLLLLHDQEPLEIGLLVGAVKAKTGTSGAVDAFCKVYGSGSAKMMQLRLFLRNSGRLYTIRIGRKWIMSILYDPITQKRTMIHKQKSILKNNGQYLYCFKYKTIHDYLHFLKKS
jgi:hypothetical protein